MTHDEEAERIFWELAVEASPPSPQDMQAAAMKLLEEAERVMAKCGLRLEQDAQHANVWYFTPSRVVDGWVLTAAKQGVVVSDNVMGIGPKNPEAIPLSYDGASKTLRGKTESGEPCSGLAALASDLRRRFNKSDSTPR